jgi:Zn-dependent protease/CBS domain-containing protein
MFGKTVTLFHLLGFKVKIDLSWLILGILVSWTLAVGVFPALYEGLTPVTYWMMGAAGVVLLLFSIVFHELCHSLVARYYGFPIKGITLFIFGGVAEMDQEPPTAKAEFWMAAAGPASSAVLAAGLDAIHGMAVRGQWPVSIVGVAGYLGDLNLILALFNLVPAFPLDGGRILRAALWGWKGDFDWATRIASRLGGGFGLVLILLGVFTFIIGNVVTGVWWALIGLFLRAAARMSYQQMVVGRELQGEPVSRFMNTNPVVIGPSLTLRSFVDDYLLKYHFKMYPVIEGDKVIGCVTSDRLRAVPRNEWSSMQVREIMGRVSSDNSVSPERDAMQTWRLMRGTGRNRLMVVAGERLVGIVTLRDLMEYLSLKFDLDRRP